MDLGVNITGELEGLKKNLDAYKVKHQDHSSNVSFSLHLYFSLLKICVHDKTKKIYFAPALEVTKYGQDATESDFKMSSNKNI